MTPIRQTIQKMAIGEVLVLAVQLHQRRMYGKGKHPGITYSQIPTLLDKLSFRYSIYSARSTRRTNADWRTVCLEILDLIWNAPDSEPFREPVDLMELPGNYHK